MAAPTAQAVVYSQATGRVRRVIDPAPAVVEVGAGEAFLLITKRAPPRGTTLYDWQVLACRATKRRPVPLHPSVDAHVTATAGVALTDVPDRYVVVDGTGKILRVAICDPACGDSVEGCTLIAHPRADERWTYANGVFTGPTIETKSGPVVLT